MKDELFNKHLEAIDGYTHEYDDGNGGSHYATDSDKAAQSSVEITLGYMKEFAEWCVDNDWLLIDTKNHQWRQWSKDKKHSRERSTEALLNEFFLTSKK